MNDTNELTDTDFETPPVFLRPAVDDAFFGRGDFELRQNDFRAVVRVRPRSRTQPAVALPRPLEDMPTEPLEIPLPAASTSDSWHLSPDLIPTWRVDVPNPIEVLPRLAMNALTTDRHRVGTFRALSRASIISWDEMTTAPWEAEESAASWRTLDLVGLPAVVVAVAALWAAAWFLI